MKNITLLTLGLGLTVLLLGCACADNFIEESIKEPPKVKPDAVFDDISENVWVCLKKEVALNGIEMNGDTGTVSYWGIFIKYDYSDSVLVLHKVKVGFPASLESLGGWSQERVLDLVKEKIAIQQSKL